jgi:hypothetical protein
LIKRFQQAAWLSVLFSSSTITLLALTVTQSIDLVTGLLTSTVLGFSSIYGLSYSRQKTAQRHGALWMSRKSNVEEDLLLIGTKELDRVHQKIQDGIIPFSRFT